MFIFRSHYMLTGSSYMLPNYLHKTTFWGHEATPSPAFAGFVVFYAGNLMACSYFQSVCSDFFDMQIHL